MSQPRVRRRAGDLTSRHTVLTLGVPVGLVAFAVYLKTLDQTLPPPDGGDLISAAYVLGIAHPPGYPLLMLLGHVIMAVPIAEPAVMMNLLSAICSAAAVGIVAVTIHRLIRAHKRADTGSGLVSRLAPVAGAGGALLLAFSTPFWSYSVVAEAFALNNLFAGLLLLVGLEYHLRPTRRLILTLGLLFGLALTNQQTIVLLAPALGLLVGSGLWQRRSTVANLGAFIWRIAVRDLGAGAVAVVIGLLPYLYLPAAASANPPVNWGDPNTFSRFVMVVTRSDYGSTTLFASPLHGSISDILTIFAGDMATGFLVGGLMLACAGIVWAARNRPAAGLALLCAFVVSGPIFLAVANPPILDELSQGIIARFFILPSIPVGIAAGLGTFQVVEWGNQASNRVAHYLLGLHAPSLASALPRAFAIGTGVAILLTLPAVSLAAHLSVADHSSDNVIIEYSEDLLANLKPNAILLSTGDHNTMGVMYLQEVEGVRRDVALLDVQLMYSANYVQTVRRLHPEVDIPFDTYDGGHKTSIAQILRGNVGRLPVYWVGAITSVESEFPFDYAAVRFGLVHELLPAAGTDNTSSPAPDPSTPSMQLHYPTGRYPATSWEHYIETVYAIAALEP